MLFRKLLFVTLSSFLTMAVAHGTALPLTHFSEPELMKALEAQGLNLESLFQGEPSRQGTAQEFARHNSAYRQFTQALENDILEAKERFLSNPSMKTRKITIGTNTQSQARLFDPRWFSSSYARYELVGVINRLDRADFHMHTCGELRFIYRLSYQKEGRYSRLPVTINAVFYVPGSAQDNRNDCKKMATQWVAPAQSSKANTLAQQLLSDSGALSPRIFDRRFLKAIEVNVQALRIPSTLLPDLGGSAEYLLRVFHLQQGQLVRGKLENTPDVEKIQKDPALWEEFKSLFQNPEVLKRINAGIFLLPEKFLTTKASSFSPYGLARIANRPYDRLLTEEDIVGNFNNKDVVTSAKAALLRLNDMSCVGCHQARATAGFHFLGIDKKETHYYNSLVFEGSGHFAREVERRRQYLHRVQRNLYPRPVREFSFSPTFTEGFLNNQKGSTMYRLSQKGDFCGLKGQGSFAAWKCAEGLQCASYDEAEGLSELGRCIDKRKLVTGDACEVGTMMSDPLSMYDDKLSLKEKWTCAGGNTNYSCRAKRGGFPSGMCAAGKGCANLLPGEICGHAAGDGFSECIIQIGQVKNGHEVTFVDCVEKSTYETPRGFCDAQNPCRNDYVCSGVRGEKNRGACLPSYFLFQIRADGHPNP